VTTASADKKAARGRLFFLLDCCAQAVIAALREER
jgi:hypothetical protein